MLNLYNTFSRRKEQFEPLDPNHIRMYVCGPTVYDFAHIGNARPVVVFDVLYRLLRHLYPKVTYVRNITDIDDKINARAKEDGEEIRSLTKRTALQFQTDMELLGALAPDHEPRATDHIQEMIALIERLLERGCAYEAEGHVLFHVPGKLDYGKLSGRSGKEQIAGARVEVASYKRDPTDFSLWKPSVLDEPGWDSPWGRGRPGWHIECSAMSIKYLGLDFDIHGGGQDLIFPHHENELAQSTCAYPNNRFASYWLHNGYLTMESEKMSKSLGNIVAVRELLETYSGEVIRLALLSSHYRQPLDFSSSGLLQAKTRLDRWYRSIAACSGAKATPPDINESVISQFLDALCDDLNTPRAMTELSRQADIAFNSSTTSKESAKGIDFGALKGRLIFMGSLLGLLQHNPEEWFKGDSSSESITSNLEIDRLISDRRSARDNKNFLEADRIRTELEKLGIILEDTHEGTNWRRS